MRCVQRLAASGSYGKVTASAANPARAIKRTKLFDNNELVGSNLAEAAFIKAMVRKDVQVRNHIGVNSVEMDERANIMIEMERGDMTLHNWIMTTPFSTRMNHLRDFLKEMVTGLNDLHEHGMVHCDFKPDNVILVSSDNVCKPRIIDFGSVRYINSTSDVVCTYPFCAPEALVKRAAPTTACDAYSLGATMLFFIYKAYLYDFKLHDTRAKALKQHQEGKIIIPERPSVVDPEMYDIMYGLLHPDPAKRLKISTLYHRLSGDVVELVDSPKRCLDPRGPIERTWWTMDARAHAIDALYADALNMRTFMLSVNLLDRYVDVAACYAGGLTVDAARIVAEMVLHPEWLPVRSRSMKRAIMSILNALNFALFTETADVILMRDYGVEYVDYALLKDVLKMTWGSTAATVDAYLKACCSKKTSSRKRTASDAGM